MKLVDILKLVASASGRRDLQRLADIYDGIEQSEARIKAAAKGEIVMLPPIKHLPLFGRRGQYMSSFRVDD